MIAFACFELAALGFFTVQVPAGTTRPTEQLIGEGTSREKVSYYATQDWAERFWYEFRRSRNQQFYPFVDWRRAPFKGQTIEINQEGVRLTPGADCRPGSYKVFTFGASEMWGTGSPSWGTIPAHLQKGLEKVRRGPVCVTNFAESAYVSMQGIITLLMQLRSGNVPDVVVFYTIADDVYAAYQSGRVGILENFDQIAARFEGHREPDTFLDLMRRTYSYRLIDLFMGKLMIADSKQEEPAPRKISTYESMGIDVGTLSALIVREYFGNYEIVNALAREYGFKYFLFLPPLVSMGNKPLTSEEQEMKRRMESEAALHSLVTAVYQAVERESPNYPNLYSMVPVFDGYDPLVWIDESHVTPVGNQLIAERMLRAIAGSEGLR
ncbi:MAG: hypothetical protein P0111_06305 [Nitrospira sp.]|nr:hypothetical protein [Nitrospira sp.]